jgi:hypothetical protein
MIDMKDKFTIQQVPEEIYWKIKGLAARRSCTLRSMAMELFGAAAESWDGVLAAPGAKKRREEDKLADYKPKIIWERRINNG